MVFFYKTDLIYEMLLHPQFFGPRMKARARAGREATPPPRRAK